MTLIALLHSPLIHFYRLLNIVCLQKQPENQGLETQLPHQKKKAQRAEDPAHQEKPQRAEDPASVVQIVYELVG